jgi:hypothetical protein
LTRSGEAGDTGLQSPGSTDEDHLVREYVGGLPPEGRLLVESGELIAGSMARSAATILFDAGSSRVRLDADLSSALARAATAGAGVLTEGQGFRRAQIRAGAALAFATELAVTRTSQGRTVRTDGVLTRGESDRSALDEIVEAVASAARATVEEWRVRHLGYVVAETAVSPDLDPDLVLSGLRLAGSLTGRQWAFLAAVGRRERIHLPIAPTLPVDPRAWREWGALEDLTDLRQRGLLDPPPAQPRPGGAALPRLRAADLRLTRRGILLHRLLALDLLHEDRVIAALADLGLPRS